MSRSTMGSSPRQIRAAIGTLERAGFVVGVAVVSPSAPAVRTYRTKAERLAGNGFPCTVPGEDCGRRDLRTPNRASIHGIDAGGHAPKS